MGDKTTIAINIETKKRLDKLGDKGDTYDKIVSKLLDKSKG
jgi:hypothetical protein